MLTETNTHQTPFVMCWLGAFPTPGPRHAELMRKALLRAAMALDYKEIHRRLLNEQDYADILGSSVSDSLVLG